MAESMLGEALRARYRGYSGARPDVLALCGRIPSRVLDVGCGAGLTAKMIREQSPTTDILGVEPDQELAALARRYADDVIVARIEDVATIEQLRAKGPFGLIICADVLEHLVDPWLTLSVLSTMLESDGLLVTSIPNVRHISTFVDLGLFGRWPRRDRGIHDKTHLRYFARRDILDMARGAGLKRVNERRNLRLIEASAWTMVPAKLLDFWPFRPFLTFQYLHSWRR